MADLRIAVIGCGGIGGVHLRSWAKVEGATVVAACDADASRAEASGGRTYTDYRELLANEPLHAVDICTPPNLHREIAEAAFERKLPVTSEKPLARNPEEARAMVEAAERAGVPFMTAFCHRFQPDVEFVKALIDRGDLGRVLMFRNRFGGLLAGMEKKWFSNPDVAGGGALMDTSIHSVDLFRHLVGEVKCAMAALATYNPEIRGLEDSAAMVLTAENGAIGTIEASWQTPYCPNVVEIYGERGAAVIDYNTGETKYHLQGSEDWSTAEGLTGDRFAEELRHFAAVLRGETELRVTGRDGLRAVEVVHMAYRNAVA